MTRTLLVLLLVAAGCGSGGATSADRPTVAASLYPFAWLAERIAPDAEVELLGAEAGADPHDVQLTPSEVGAVRDADVVVHVGDIGYQPQVERAVSQARGTVLTAFERVDSLTTAGDHGHDRLDPHLWHSPAAMARVAEALGEALAEADPDGEYAARTDRVVAELEALDREVAEAFSDCERDEVVVSHAGYAYLLEPHGIHQEAVTGPGGHGEPSPQRLRELAAELRELGQPVVLSEPAEGRRAAEALARATGLELVDVLPLGTVTPEQAAEGYPALVRRNVSAFAAALGC